MLVHIILYDQILFYYFFSSLFDGFLFVCLFLNKNSSWDVLFSMLKRSMFINTHDFLVSPGNSNLCFDTKSTLFESVGLSADVDPDGDSGESDNDLDPVSPLSLSPPLSPRNSAPMSENVNKSRLRGKNCTEIPLPELRQIPRYSHSSFPLVGQSYFGAYGDCYNPELVVQGLR